MNSKKRTYADVRSDISKLLAYDTGTLTGALGPRSKYRVFTKKVEDLLRYKIVLEKKFTDAQIDYYDTIVSYILKHLSDFTGKKKLTSDDLEALYEKVYRPGDDEKAFGKPTQVDEFNTYWNVLSRDYPSLIDVPTVKKYYYNDPKHRGIIFEQILPGNDNPDELQGSELSREDSILSLWGFWRYAAHKKLKVTVLSFIKYPGDSEYRLIKTVRGFIPKVKRVKNHGPMAYTYDRIWKDYHGYENPDIWETIIRDADDNIIEDRRLGIMGKTYAYIETPITLKWNEQQFMLPTQNVHHCFLSPLLDHFKQKLSEQPNNKLLKSIVGKIKRRYAVSKKQPFSKEMIQEFINMLKYVGLDFLPPVQNGDITPEQEEENHLRSQNGQPPRWTVQFINAVKDHLEWTPHIPEDVVEVSLTRSQLDAKILEFKQNKIGFMFSDNPDNGEINCIATLTHKYVENNYRIQRDATNAFMEQFKGFELDAIDQPLLSKFVRAAAVTPGSPMLFTNNITQDHKILDMEKAYPFCTMKRTNSTWYQGFPTVFTGFTQNTDNKMDLQFLRDHPGIYEVVMTLGLFYGMVQLNRIRLLKILKMIRFAIGLRNYSILILRSLLVH